MSWTSQSLFVALWVAALLVTGCYKDQGTDPRRETFGLIVNPTTAPADGSSLVRIRVSIPAQAARDRRSVTITTSAGVLLDGGQATTTIAALDSIVETDLRAPISPGQARIRVQFAGDTREAEVTFEIAYPTQILVDPTHFVLSAGLQHETKVTAQLRRGSGAVTAGRPVTFEAYRVAGGEPIGRFGIATLSNAEGVSTVRFSAGDTDYRGDVRIVALTAGAEGQVVGETIIRIVSPPAS